MATRQVALSEQMFYGVKWAVDVNRVKALIAIHEMGPGREGVLTLRSAAKKTGISHMVFHRLFTGSRISETSMGRILDWLGAELTEVAEPVGINRLPRRKGAK